MMEFTPNAVRFDGDKRAVLVDDFVHGIDAEYDETVLDEFIGRLRIKCCDCSPDGWLVNATTVFPFCFANRSLIVDIVLVYQNKEKIEYFVFLHK